MAEQSHSCFRTLGKAGWLAGWLILLLLSLNTLAAEEPLVAQFRYNGEAWDAGLEEDTLRLAEVRWRALARPGELNATPLLGAPQLRELLATDLGRLPKVLCLTGSGALRLSDTQQSVLRDYLKAGGVLLALAGDAAWEKSLRDLLTTLLPESAWRPADETPSIGALRLQHLQWREQVVVTLGGSDLLRQMHLELAKPEPGPALTLLASVFTLVVEPPVAVPQAKLPEPTATAGSEVAKPDEILREPVLPNNDNILNELDSKYPTLRDR